LLSDVPRITILSLMVIGILFLNEKYIFIIQNLTIKIITQTERGGKN
jgi:hypothetical protein